MPSTLEKYIAKFRKLKRAPDKTGNLAPHKPILLLALIESFGRKDFTGNRIMLTDQLLIIFEKAWQQLVDDPTSFKPLIAKPFFHLKTEGFWDFGAKAGMEESLLSYPYTPTLSWLDRHVAFAELPDDLADLLSSPESRAILRRELLEAYFPITQKAYRLAPDSSKDETLELAKWEMLEGSVDDYVRRMRIYQQEQKEIQVFLRSRVFQRLVPQTYEYRCAISGWRVHDTPYAMIDACHIVPFAESQNDHITNGISLSPSLHRAFDRGLVAIDDDYRVRVKAGLQESGATFMLQVFAGSKLHLPDNPKYHPDPDNLRKHRVRFGF